jgi:single-stranded-DNA-specific exonuclease
MKWVKKNIPATVVRELAERFGLDLLHASILTRRGITDPEALLYYLEDDLRFTRSPFLFNGMEDAVDRILLAADEGERVLIFGDRDADGVTATTLLFEAFQSLGLEVQYRLPMEDEKYGLSMRAVDEFAADAGSLIVTVDCGISNHAEVLHAATKGIDVIILDHHVLQVEAPPAALVVIDPKLPDCGYPFRDLSGCGVAYKLLRGLRFAASGLYKQDVALLNVRPANDAYMIEALSLSNLVETGRITETIVPGVVDLGRTRLVPFLKDRQIMVWDGELQKRILSKALGRSADVHFYDVHPDVARLIPQTAGASLLRLAELSKVGRYGEKPCGELDAFKSLFTAFALRKADAGGDADQDALQLVALSTIADLMPLRDENRILVRQGLAAMNRKPRRGIAELVARQNLLGRRLSAIDASWQLTPVINAAGRMGKPETAVKLFLEPDAVARGAWADKLLDLNQDRKRLGAESWDAIYPLARQAAEQRKGTFVIVGNPDINRGITGIVANRLADTFKAPAVVASFMADGTAVASVRSARGFNVKQLLEHCAEFFIDYGGHDAAAGFSMPLERWEDFERKASAFMAGIRLEDQDETLYIDAELPHAYLKPELVELVDRFEPFGEDNPPLVFMSRAVPILQADIVGKQDKSHLKLVLDFGKHKWPALWWNAAARMGREFNLTDRLDVVFKVTKNYWNGMESPQLVILDAQLAGNATLLATSDAGQAKHDG